MTRFVLVSDRTGGARPGVFERGLAVADLLAPDFVVQLGDLIEGYTDSDEEVDRQWAEVDAMLAGMRTPVIGVPGNHDVSTPAAAAGWVKRFGDRYGFFRRDDVLFLRLDTQDPPPSLDDLFAVTDWEGIQPAAVSEAQLAFAEDVLRDHADARWTFVLMHMPLWQGDHPAWRRLRAALGDRRYHAFAGHVHNYQRRLLDGNEHVRLGPTGGVWVLDGPGNVDHVSQVTMTADGPVVANIAVAGVFDVAGP